MYLYTNSCIRYNSKECFPKYFKPSNIKIPVELSSNLENILESKKHTGVIPNDNNKKLKESRTEPSSIIPDIIKNLYIMAKTIGIIPKNNLGFEYITQPDAIIAPRQNEGNLIT